VRNFEGRVFWRWKGYRFFGGKKPMLERQPLLESVLPGVTLS